MASKPGFEPGPVGGERSYHCALHLTTAPIPCPPLTLNITLREESLLLSSS